MVRAKRSKRNRQRQRRRTKRAQRGGSSDSVVWTFNNNAGFGCTVNMMCNSYIVAKEENKPFYIENGNWQYTHKDGWHDYFKSLTVYDPLKHAGKPSKFKHMSPQPPPRAFEKYSKCAKDIFVLNDDLEKKVNDFIRTMGKPYKAIYVRRGDKTSGPGKETDPVDLSGLIQIMDISGNDKLFIMSDDYTVNEEIEKLLPNVKLFTLTPKENRGSEVLALRALPREKMKEHAEELFTSLAIVIRAEKAWVDNRSNLGRFMKLASPDTVILYPVEEYTKNIKPDTPIEPGGKSLGT